MICVHTSFAKSKIVHRTSYIVLFHLIWSCRLELHCSLHALELSDHQRDIESDNRDNWSHIMFETELAQFVMLCNQTEQLEGNERHHIQSSEQQTTRQSARLPGDTTSSYVSHPSLSGVGQEITAEKVMDCANIEYSLDLFYDVGNPYNPRE